MDLWKRWRERASGAKHVDDPESRRQEGVLVASKLAHGRELAAAFSDDVFEVIALASRKPGPIDSGDLVCAIAAIRDSRAARALASLGLSAETLRAAVEHAGYEAQTEPAERYRASPNAVWILEHAAQSAAAQRKPSFDAEDLLLAAIREPNGVAGRALRAVGLTEARLARELGAQPGQR